MTEGSGGRDEHCIVDGVDTRFRDSGGAGSVVLLLHGWGDTLATFDALIGELDEGRFIRLDLPGFGGSALPGSPWDVARYATFVRRFLDKLGIAESSILIGHSFGGRVAIKGVANGLFTPQKLVLIAAAGAAARSGARRGAFAALAKVGKYAAALPPLSLFRERLRERLYAAVGSTDYLRAGPLRETFLNVIGENLLATAAAVHIPTLLVWGERDTETPLVEARALAGAIADSRLTVIADAGHFVHRERPEETAREIRAFLAQ